MLERIYERFREGNDVERYYKLIDNWIYFGHLDKYAILPTYPESIADSMESRFQTVDALSRTAPVFSYISSGPRTISVDFTLHRDMMDAMNTNVSNLKDNVLPLTDDYVDVLIRYLKACALPKYRTYKSGAKAVEPPWVAMKVGATIFIKGDRKSVV